MIPQTTWSIVTGENTTAPNSSVFAALLGAATAAAQQSHLLIVSGLGAQPEYRDAFYEWSATMVETARTRLGLTEEQVTYLAEDPARDPAKIDGKSDRDGITAAIRRIAQRSANGDDVFILLIGHGTSTGAESKFTIPGPDLGPAEFGVLLDELSGRRVAFINASTASGDFLPPLSGPDRVIVTATKTGFERNAAIFPRFFVRAFAQDGADTDKDGRVSILEAFEYARTEVARTYEEGKLIQTEHALIDDNGDKKGAPAGDPRTGDGALARAMYIQPAITAAAAAADPRLAALYREKRAIEERIEKLRQQKDVMPPAQYEAELEKALVELAEKNQAIKAIEGKA
jgi:hypothetical protein